MGVWIEFRCENRNNPSSWAIKPGGNNCESHSNSGPMALAGDTQKGVAFTLRKLTGAAKKSGWIKTKYGWICSYCAQTKGAISEMATTKDAS